MSRDVVVWVPPHLRPDVIEQEAAKDKLRKAREAEAAARLAVAETRARHAHMLDVGTKLVVHELEKYLRMAENPDFANALGPLDPATILKMAEFVSKNHRLDTGQATENIAHAIMPSMDFSNMTQEERDQWRALAIKGGVKE